MIRKIRGYIVITQVPAGNAPLDVRMGWVGLTLPSYGQIENDNKSHLLNSEQLAPTRRWAYAVPQKEAVEILEKNAPKAGAWFRENGFPREGGAFTFGEDEAYLVDLVSSDIN